MTLSLSTASFGRFDRLSFVRRRPARAGLGGEHRSRRRAPSTDFVDYRPYQPGDDFRRVDWNVYGRLDSLQVKLTEGRERQELVLVLDTSASMAWGEPDKLAFAAQTVAALAYIGLARQDAVRLVCLGEAHAGRTRLGPLRGRQRLPELLRALSGAQADGRVDLNAGLAECLPADASQPLVVVVSDLLSPRGIEAGLEQLLKVQADAVVLQVVSPQELEPTLAGELELIDAETRDVLEVGLSLAALDAYRARYRRWLAEQASVCGAHGVRYVQLHTDRSLPSVVLDDLRRAGVLR